MTMTPTESAAPAPAGLPREIRATVHQDAIQRVTRFFDATVRDCLNELFQNSRRAGATRVDVTITAGGTITVSDDGNGIDDPAALLAFGLSQWDERTANSEDPAGMGIYALSRMRDVTISSRCAGEGAGWKVSLEEPHFTGAAAAPLEEIPPDQQGVGATVSFRPAVDERAKDLETHVAAAAAYYPLPVSLNGSSVFRHDFLHDCFHVTEWEGVRIGVTHTRRYYRDPGINFHGVTVCDDVNARITSRDLEWHTRVDVVDCPRLELTLPARKDLVKNDFVAELKRACQRAAYQTMADARPPADVSFKQQYDAAQLGVKLPDARAELRQWEAEFAEAGRNWAYRHDRKGDRLRITDACLRMDEYMETCDQQGLARALRDHMLPAVLREPEGEMAGYRWYDRMTVVNRLEIQVHGADGTVTDLAQARESGVNPFTDRPERIVYRLRTRDCQGHERWLEYDGDVAFYCEDVGWEAAETRPLVTRESTITPEELTELIMDSFFYYSDDSEADSQHTQEQDFRKLAEETARDTLLTRNQAVEASIRDAVASHVRRHVPEGWNAVIYLSEDGQTEIELNEY